MTLGKVETNQVHCSLARECLDFLVPYLNLNFPDTIVFDNTLKVTLER